MQVKTKYIRLLSYDNALKVIDWVMARGGKNYAYITVGGVGVQMFDHGFEELKVFIEELTERYEINDEHPTKTEEKIIENLKESSAI